MLIIMSSVREYGCSYFGLLVEVGSVFGQDLGNGHFILLSCQMEGSQATLHEEHTGQLRQSQQSAHRLHHSSTDECSSFVEHAGSLLD